MEPPQINKLKVESPKLSNVGGKGIERIGLDDFNTLSELGDLEVETQEVERIWGGEFCFEDTAGSVEHRGCERESRT